MKYWIIILSYICIIGTVFATSYKILNFDTQLGYSSGLIEGEYLSKEYKKTSNGEVVTVFNFKVDKYIGLKRNEILNQNHFQITVPGGVWQGEIYHASNIPRFNNGEKVVVIIKKHGQNFFLQDLAMSKYLLIEKQGEKYLKSELFPNHHELGRIDYLQFIESARKIYTSDFLSFKDGKKVFLTNKNEINKRSKNKTNKRSIASIEENVMLKDKIKKKSISIFWPAVILALLGVYSLRIRKKNK